MDNKTKKIVINGLMIALVCLATMTIQIPIPGTQGYVNVGDSVIFISSILFGPFTGMIAGGVGSALADILSGYSHWALFTLIIKGLEGYIVGVTILKRHTIINMVSSTLLGSIVMVIGYFLAGILLNGGVLVSAGSIPANIVQGITSIVIAVPITCSLRKTSYVKRLNAQY